MKEKPNSAKEEMIAITSGTKSKHGCNAFRVTKVKLLEAKATFLSWSETVDINCYSKVFDYKKNHIAQLVWLTIFLCSTGATLFVITKSVSDFLNYDVVSLTEIVYERPSTFPTVTFCDNNPLSTKEAERLMQRVSNENSNLTDWYNLTELAKMQAANPSYGDENRMKLGFNLSQIFYCSLDLNDCRVNLHWYYSYEHGNCYQYNSGHNLANEQIDVMRTSRGGVDFGPIIGVFPLINQNEYFTSYGNGLVVFVHDNKHRPSDNGVYVKPGEAAYIAVRRRFIKKYPSPYSDCLSLDSYSSDLYAYMKAHSNESYRQKDCFELCIQRMVIGECGCYDLNYPSLNTRARPCLSMSDLFCLEDQWERLDVDACITTSCPLECDSSEFELTMSTIEFPGKSLYDYLIRSKAIEGQFERFFNQSPSFDVFKMYAVGIQVYYPSLEYMQISETPKTGIYDLFTQIGGALGLFVSFSLFTLFEMVELAVLLAYGLFVQKTSQN